MKWKSLLLPQDLQFSHSDPDIIDFSHKEVPNLNLRLIHRYGEEFELVYSSRARTHGMLLHPQEEKGLQQQILLNALQLLVTATATEQAFQASGKPCSRTITNTTLYAKQLTKPQAFLRAVLDISTNNSPNHATFEQQLDPLGVCLKFPFLRDPVHTQLTYYGLPNSMSSFSDPINALSKETVAEVLQFFETQVKATLSAVEFLKTKPQLVPASMLVGGFEQDPCLHAYNNSFLSIPLSLDWSTMYAPPKDSVSFAYRSPSFVGHLAPSKKDTPLLAQALAAYLKPIRKEWQEHPLAELIDINIERTTPSRLNLPEEANPMETILELS